METRVKIWCGVAVLTLTSGGVAFARLPPTTPERAPQRAPEQPAPVAPLPPDAAKV
jgi:hypothetical protein